MDVRASVRVTVRVRVAGRVGAPEFWARTVARPRGRKHTPCSQAAARQSVDHPPVIREVPHLVAQPAPATPG